MKINKCSVVIVLGVFMGFAAIAAGTPHPVGKWCKADQQALCAGMEWGTGLGKCLHEKAANVSPLCKAHHPKLFGTAVPPNGSTGE